jgi:hypothetical protein
MFKTIAIAILCAGPAVAQTCYRLPFSNPNLADGWGSTCCGRTNPHRGVDFPQAAGTAIPAVADGVVRLKASSPCLGNVVVVQHADGMFSGYNHMNAQSPLAVGTVVTMGQIVGKVGSTGSCAFGAHLHLTMAPTAGGYASGVTVDPYKYIVAHGSCNHGPRGALDAAACESISGWAQDLDAPAASIAAHVYIGGPAGNPSAHGFPLTANLNRADLCTTIGSCAHGFSLKPPASFFDGLDHPVYAYGIDSAGGPPTLLGQRTLKCDAAALPKIEVGQVKRHVPSPAALTAWKLATQDIAPMADAVLDAIPLGAELPAEPALIHVEGTGDLYVREQQGLRDVTPAALGAWGFGRSEGTRAPDIEAALHGAPWPATRFVVKGSGPDVYLIGAAPPLWAEAIDDDFPDTLAAGKSRPVTFHFHNRGSVAWNAGVSLCELGGGSCARFAEVPAGGKGGVTFELRAPPRAGTTKVCFGLFSGTHPFFALGQGGPSEDELCRTLQVTAPELMSLDGDDPEAVSGGCAAVPGAELGWACAALAAWWARRRSPARP